MHEKIATFGPGESAELQKQAAQHEVLAKARKLRHDSINEQNKKIRKCNLVG